MKVNIFTSPTEYNHNEIDVDNCYNICVEAGCLYCIEHNIPIDLAMGDFDSISIGDQKGVKIYAKEFISVDSEKDETDTQLALNKALEMNNNDLITIHGGLGKRLDHTIANLSLLKKGNIRIIDQYTKTYVLSPGIYNIENKYKFISFFAVEEVKNLNLHGFKYELDNITLQIDDPLCISNELEGKVSFSEGLLLVIHQNER